MPGFLSHFWITGPLAFSWFPKIYLIMILIHFNLLLKKKYENKFKASKTTCVPWKFESVHPKRLFHNWPLWWHLICLTYLVFRVQYTHDNREQFLSLRYCTDVRIYCNKRRLVVRTNHIFRPLLHSAVNNSHCSWSSV